METGGTAHVASCPGKEIGELCLLIRGEAANNPRLIFLNGFIDALVTGQALGQNVNPLAASVLIIRTEFDEILLFQPG